MMNFDLTSWAGLTAMILATVSGLKKAFPTWVNGKEEFLAIVLGIVLGLAAKATGALSTPAGAQGWIYAALGGVAAGLSAQVAHDKLLNPLIKKEPK